MESSGTSSNNDPCVQEEKAAAFTPPAATSQTSDGYGPPAATPHTFDGYGLVTAVDFQDMEATKVRIAKARAINALRVKNCRVNKRFKAQIDEGFCPVERKIFCCGEGGGDILECIATNDLSVIKVTQRSEMKEINGYKEGARGKGVSKLRGAIVTPLVSGHIMHRGVPECFFLDECYRRVEREILDDDDGDDSGNINENIKRTDLNIVKVTQCTEMKEIDGYKEGSRGGGKFRGAIVSQIVAGDIRYRIVAEARFLRNDECFAKHGSHSNAAWINAFAITGNLGGKTLVAWESKPSELMWLPKHRVLDHKRVADESRTTSVPNRFEPGTSSTIATSAPRLANSAIDHYRSYFHACGDFKAGYYTINMMITKGKYRWEENKQKERDFETRVHKIKELIKANLKDCTDKGISLSGDKVLLNYLNKERKLDEDIQKRIEYFPPRDQGNLDEGGKKKYEEEMENYKEEETRLISEAIKAVKQCSKTPNPNRKLRTTPPENPNIELSLTFDVLSGKIAGSLGKKLDSKLGLIKDCNAAKYIGFIIGRVGEMLIRDREALGKGFRKANRKRCKSEGCGEWAWNGGRGHCYNHADPARKLCCVCKINTPHYAGGLCQKCSKQSTGKREKIQCPACGVRESARPGWRCKHCIGSKFQRNEEGDKKVKKAKKAVK
jgi:hypothetical protein